MNQNLIIYSEAIPTNSTAQNIYSANNFQSTEKTTNSTNQQKNYQLQKDGKICKQNTNPIDGERLKNYSQQCVDIKMLLCDLFFHL